MGLLDIDNLEIGYADSAAPVVAGLSFSVSPGEALGIVGESGSGKTQTALSILGLTPANAALSGSIRFEGQELIGAGEATLNHYRACRIGMVFQDPRLALNPYVRIGKQMRRILLAHKLCKPAEAEARCIAMLRRVGLPDPERQYASFPHQLSGGMRQRAMIGAALIAEPALLIADEPTTALDVTVQAQILKLIRDLRTESGTALLLITHDLGVIAGNCDRMLVMDQGRKVEEGETRDIFDDPVADRTRALLAAAPDVHSGVLATDVDAEAETVLEIEGLSVSFRERRSGWGEDLNAVRPVDLSVREGETVAVVGESGSGKTSLVRAALGLIPADAGSVAFLGKPLPGHVTRRPNEVRRNLQMVFQDPLASLNPAMTVTEIVMEPLRIHGVGMKRRERANAVQTMLGRVGLDEDLSNRYPHELSGGQAQRVAIARSLILTPRILVCDEAVAALDGTVQRGILELLLEEQRRSGLALVFITHDLAVVRQISHRIMVMYMGRLCEVAPNDQVFQRPRHPYTKALLDAVPKPHPGAAELDPPVVGETASVLNPPSGCPFHPRCPHAVASCQAAVPSATESEGAIVACHRADELDLSY
jgi:oligopeptide/dipeptide ABC transporter ATP-binding protein